MPELSLTLRNRFRLSVFSGFAITRSRRPYKHRCSSVRARGRLAAAASNGIAAARLRWPQPRPGIAALRDCGRLPEIDCPTLLPGNSFRPEPRDSSIAAQSHRSWSCSLKQCCLNSLLAKPLRSFLLAPAWLPHIACAANRPLLTSWLRSLAFQQVRGTFRTSHACNEATLRLRRIGRNGNCSRACGLVLEIASRL